MSGVEGPAAGRELGEEVGGEGVWVVVIGWLVVAGKEGGMGVPKFAWVTGCLTRGQREAQGSGRCGGGEGDVARAAADGRLEQSTEERGGWQSGDVQRQRPGRHAGTEVRAAVIIARVSDRCGAASVCQAEGGQSTLGRGGGGGEVVCGMRGWGDRRRRRRPAVCAASPLGRRANANAPTRRIGQNWMGRTPVRVQRRAHPPRGAARARGDVCKAGVATAHAGCVVVRGLAKGRCR